jgi:ubiquitin C-terminal hydrolase
MSKFAAKTLSEEKADIKRAMKTPFQEGAIWQPMALSWFEKWKTYVNYDDEVPEPRDKELVDSLHPGEVDNNSLQGSFGDEMRRDAVEGRDYVLLPTHFASMLIDKYGGGPSYPRKVLNVGQYYNPIYQVNLWPIRIEVYLCDRNQPVPVQSDERFKRRYFGKNMKLDEVAEDLSRLFSAQRSYNATRYWLRDSPPDTSAESSKGTGRMLTCDVVDFDGNWRFVRSDANRNIQEILGEHDCIELIIEVAPFRNPKDSEWPRFQQLEAWKQDLRVGDMVDAKDRKGKFYAAKILTIDEQKNLLVHFFGWSESNDEKILQSDIINRIAPLHGHSFDRSKWEEGNKVDITITDASNNTVWATGTIIGTDPKTDRVEVMIEAKDKTEALKKVAASAATKISTTGTSMRDEPDDFDTDFASIDDDALKKKKNAATHTSTDSIVTGMEEVKTTDSDAVTLAPAEDETMRIWVDIYGDAIAPQYTHTAPIRSVNTSSYGSGYGISSLYSSHHSYSSYDRHTKGTPPVAGAVGLQNLGNTCFMNSILQCLSNTHLLSEMFLSGVYRDQINYDNPLGHSGKIVLTYGKLIKDMWSGAYTKVVPREFKTVIGDYRPQFAGYEQQDSQEMMSCLLDGLHEDLNRIKKKPYTKKIESKGRDDQLIASESWRRFLLRNDSLIVERFFGLQKSHVTCRNCGKESVTFDPYATLSVPIPIRNTRIVPVIVQLLPHSSVPIRLSLEVELTATMQDAKKLLIDKLIELKLLSLPTTAAVDEPQNDNAMVTDDSYELVQKEDETAPSTVPSTVDDVDCTTVPAGGKRKNAAVHSNVNRTSVYESFHFHFGVLYNSRTTTVSKNYDVQNMKNTAISAFVGKMDYLAAFQLEYPVADWKSIGMYNYYYSSTFTTTSVSKKKNLMDELDDVDEGNKTPGVGPAYFGMDVVIGTREGMRLDLTGYPRRMSFVQGSTTNADVHAAVRQMLKRLIPKDSPLWKQEESAWPYELLVTTSYGSQVHRTVEKNEAAFVPLKENMEILVVHWHSSAVKEGLVQMQKARELHDLSLSSNNANGNNDIDDDFDDDEYYPATSYSSKHQQQHSNKRAKKTLSIYDCLDKYIEREQLADTETVYCNRCKEMLAPIKKMDVWTAPDILILHLKRFQFIAGQYMVLREKINDVVDFPIEGLDLSSYVQGPVRADAPPLYDLYAVSHHMGGLGGGHYTATAKNFLDNKWYYFNDSSVTPADPNSAVNATAYVLFYKRR